MSLAFSALPPRSIFAHDETLHRIILPPLASFLTDLHLPEHILKLKDILDRYRTPKSYHRIDVREVDSSEVPSDEPAADTGAASAAAEKERLKRGRTPLVLPPEVELEAYLTDQVRLHQEAPVSLNGGETGNGDGRANAEAGPSRSPRPCPSSEPMDITLPSPYAGGPIKTVDLPADIALARPLSPTLQSLRVSAPPPMGPRRRVRELRLDLRTLDAAALFALENWRRQVMGIEKLEMEHPDSVWYKDPTPTPPPATPPVKVTKKRGRPRKIHRAGHAEEGTGRVEDSGPDEARAGSTELVILGDTLSPSVGVMEQDPGASPAVPRKTDDAAHADVKLQPSDTAEDSIIAAAVAGPSSIRRSRSADIILHDAYNEKEEADPDFVPPAHLRPRRGPPRRRKSGIAAEDILNDISTRAMSSTPLSAGRGAVAGSQVSSPHKGRSGPFSDAVGKDDIELGAADDMSIPHPASILRSNRVADLPLNPAAPVEQASPMASCSADPPHRPAKRGMWGPEVVIPVYHRRRRLASDVALSPTETVESDVIKKAPSRKRKSRSSWARGNANSKRRRQRAVISLSRALTSSDEREVVAIDADEGNLEEEADRQLQGVDDLGARHKGKSRSAVHTGAIASTSEAFKAERGDDRPEEHDEGSSSGPSGSGGEWDFLKSLS